MNTVVCVGEGFYANGPLPLGGEPRAGGAAPVPVPNPADEAAVEAAVRLAARHDGRVTIVTVGAMTAATRRSFTGLGADASIQVLDEPSDTLQPFQVGWLLAAAIRPLAPDLVLCGDRATSGYGSGLVPFALAECLGLPVVPGAVAIEVRGRTLAVERVVERGNRELLEAAWPAVVTVAPASGRARYPAFAKAKRASHRCYGLADLGLTRATLAALAAGPFEVRREPARPRPKKFYVPPASLSAADRLAALMAGGPPSAARTDGSRRFVEGPASALGATVLDYLRRERILDG